MSAIGDWVNRLLSRSSKPTKPAASKFSAQAKNDAEQKAKDYEMDMAKAKEQSRRSAM